MPIMTYCKNSVYRKDIPVDINTQTSTHESISSPANYMPSLRLVGDYLLSRGKKLNVGCREQQEAAICRALQQQHQALRRRHWSVHRYTVEKKQNGGTECSS